MIQKLLKGLLTDKNQEEHDALHQWQDDMKANVEGLRQMLGEQADLSSLKDYRSVDSTKAWENIQSRTQLKGQVRLLPILSKVAAVMLLVLGAWFGFSYLNQQTTASLSDQAIASGSQDKKITLQDQTTVNLMANSFLGKLDNRHVSLEGRAYFDVAKDPSHPFIIDLNHGSITVLGTEFDIITHKDFTQIYVTEGRVKFTYNSEEIIMTANDMVYVTKDGIQKSTQANVQINAWQTKKLVFSNETIMNVLYSVASLHQKQLIIESSAQQMPDQCKINTTYTSESLEEILTELKDIAGLSYVIDNNKIVVKSFKC